MFLFLRGTRQPARTPEAGSANSDPTWLTNVKFDTNRFCIVSGLIATAALLSACGGGQTASESESSAPATGQRGASALAADDANWTVCGNEGVTCVFTGTRQVRFGTATLYASKTVTGSVYCHNSVFGDPAYGVQKYCRYGDPITQAVTAPAAVTAPVATTTTTSTTSTTTWQVCAVQGTFCQFSGTRQVRYGTTRYGVTRTFTNGVACTDAIFGDPDYGNKKTCWVGEPAATTAVATSNTLIKPTTSTTSTTTSTTSTVPVVSTASTASTTSTTSLADQPIATASSSIPTPQGIAGKPVVGRIIAVSGQVIENLHISTSNGSCITVPQGVTNVTIRNNEIGPCGTAEGTVRNEGVSILPGASNIRVERNVIHDISSGVTAFGANHPIVVDRNFVYNIRGPMWQGNMVQFSGVRGGSGQSKVTCNVKDGQYRPGLVTGTYKIGDHISMYNTLGSAQSPIEIAYNRVLGDPTGAEESGSGMQLGDGENGGSTLESGWYFVHHNTMMMTNGVAIAVSGGHDIRVENNRVDQRGGNLESATGWSFSSKNFSTNLGCYNISFANNQSTVARLWAFNHDGSAGLGYFGGGGCTVSTTGNDYSNAALTASTPRATFDQPYSQCN